MNQIGPTERTITRAEFARQLGVSRAAVTQAVQAGRFADSTLADDGKLRWPAAREDWLANADPRGQPHLEIEAAPAAADDAANAVRKTTLTDDRARLLQLKAQQAEIELARSRGELVNRADVETRLTDLAGDLAALVQQIVTWADELTALPQGDLPRMRAALAEKVRTLREAMAERAMRWDTAADTDGDDGA